MKLFVHAYGSGPAVVFLHGMPTPPDHLDLLAHRLASTFRCLTVHLPGYGSSPRLPPGFSLSEIHESIEETLADEAPAGVALVGFSAGAYHALALALRRRIAPSKVVSLAGFAGLDERLRMEYRKFAELLRGGVDPAPLVPKRMLSNGYLIRHPDAATEMMGWARATEGDNLAAELDAFAVSEDLLPRLACLDVPILARVGTNDIATPPPMSEAIGRVAPRAVVERVEGAGHALLVEDLPATSLSVLAFLNAGR